MLERDSFVSFLGQSDAHQRRTFENDHGGVEWNKSEIYFLYV